MQNDSWKNRSQGMKCKTCMWFAAKALAVVNPDNPGQIDARGALGRCRRHSPTMDGFPAVFEIDWCGDHKLDENKI